MKMAFLLNEFRPFGGMPRDCVRLAKEAASRDHAITIITRTWQGDPLRLPGVDVVLLGRRGLTNTSRDRHFVRQAHAWLEAHPQDVVLGFLRMPGLNAYFAADPCFEAKTRRLKPRWFRWTPRYRRFATAERAIFGRGQPVQILLLHPGEIATYQQIYGTELDRLHVLPPGIERPDDHESTRDEARQSVRAELGLSGESEAPLVLLAGSGFRTKGLDRALVAIAAHPEARLVVAGQDTPDPFLALARRLRIEERVHFLGGRTDLPRWMLGCDVLVHPAYSENTGTVLLEALVRGLPVIASGVCGFANHVRRSRGGVVLEEPLSQQELNETLAAFLADTPLRESMRRAGSTYGVSQDLYNCHQRAVDLLETFSSNKASQAP